MTVSQRKTLIEDLLHTRTLAVEESVWCERNLNWLYCRVDPTDGAISDGLYDASYSAKIGAWLECARQIDALIYKLEIGEVVR
jgi:hypothetical protein